MENLYIITAVTSPLVNPSLVGEIVSLEGVYEREVRLDPDFMGEHWYIKPGEIRVAPYTRPATRKGTP